MCHFFEEVSSALVRTGNAQENAVEEVTRRWMFRSGGIEFEVVEVFGIFWVGFYESANHPGGYVDVCFLGGRLEEVPCGKGNCQVFRFVDNATKRSNQKLTMTSGESRPARSCDT